MGRAHCGQETPQERQCGHATEIHGRSAILGARNCSFSPADAVHTVLGLASTCRGVNRRPLLRGPVACGSSLNRR
eukprot:11202311-Lingulodinium_polyedra.AAC.1